MTLLVTDASFVERYTYKTSSYIWTLAYFFIGYYFLKNRISSTVLYIFLFGYLVLYVFGTGNYPDALINWFKDFDNVKKYFFNK